MRVLYSSPPDRAWAQHYAMQSMQSGAGFVGMPYQRGAGLGSFFKGVFRALLPMAKSAGKTLGRQALSTGAQIASDMVSGDTIKVAVKRRGKQATKKLLKKAVKKIQTGGRRKKRRKTSVKKTKRKRKTPTRKRKKSSTKKRRKVSDQLGFYYK
jgi:hypothetical protein